MKLTKQQELVAVWGDRKITGLNKVMKESYCGKLTVREIAAIVLADSVNFPQGLDTPVCIGDFEGNFCTNVLSVTLGGEPKDGLPGDHVCISGDPHGDMA